MSMTMLFMVSLWFPSLLWAQGALENPAQGTVQSGIGIVSGWKCSATRLEVVFDSGAPIQAAYGTTRGDTQAVCGDSNNGFGLLWNWNLLGGGSHTVRVLADGVEFAQTTFSVATTGAEFLTGLSGQALAPQFPNPDADTVLAWQESLQNFVIIGSVLHSPDSGSGIIPAPYDSFEGAGIFAADGQFLGEITTNCFDSDALCNEFGSYGSEFSAVSILNEFGTYGGEFSTFSPFNRFTATPPLIVDGETVVAFLTVNTSLRPRIDPYTLLGWLKVNE